MAAGMFQDGLSGESQVRQHREDRSQAEADRQTGGRWPERGGDLGEAGALRADIKMVRSVHLMLVT